ncbi:heat shock factor protein 5 [Chanos chanos]|uniref:Heat shock factor protein 5 n=1 Tax=Chanos chanos TaxID=29144 RepID=A0A6J2WWX8_CHACN|nr:heat shock factor protein 5 [Chanos chanos]
MEVDEALLTIPINPSNFPAKLWRLVNDPKNRSIRWDTHGEGVIIDQQLFETELLSPAKPSRDTDDLFKTTNFTSFIRQLNLYGFRKVIQSPGCTDKRADGNKVTDGIQHHFHNPNFKQNHPELLVNLKRLTSTNKAKLEAGLEVTCRPPNRFRRLLTNNEKSSVFVHRGFLRDNVSPYQYNLNGSQPVKEYDRTPIPSRGWVMRQNDTSSPTAFYTNKGIPVSVIRHYSSDSAFSVQPSPTSVHMQQGAQGTSLTGKKIDSFLPPHSQYNPGYYSSAGCLCCSPGSVDLDMTGCPHPSSTSFPHYGYYQQNYPAGFMHAGTQNPDWQCGDAQDIKKNDVSLDTVFKIVDEFQPSPKLCTVKVEAAEMPLQSSAPSEIHPNSAPTPATVSASMSGDANPAPVFSTVPMDSIIASSPGKVLLGRGNAAGMPENQSERGVEQDVVLSEHGKKAQKPNEETKEEASGKKPRGAVTAVIDTHQSQEHRHGKLQRSSPDLNLLVEVACKHNS